MAGKSPRRGEPSSQILMRSGRYQWGENLYSNARSNPRYVFAFMAMNDLALLCRKVTGIVKLCRFNEIRMWSSVALPRVTNIAEPFHWLIWNYQDIGNEKRQVAFDRARKDLFADAQLLMESLLCVRLRCGRTESRRG
jgi:hypothetical protein